MSLAAAHKRLDEVEIYLSPKEWCIQLVEEIRKYPHEKNFWNAMAKLEYREFPWTKAFFNLSKQAAVRYPGKRRDDHSQRGQLERELRTEYHFLLNLIRRINEIVEPSAKGVISAMGVTAARLEDRILKDEFATVAKAGAAWIKRRVAEDRRTRADGDRKTPVILKALRSFSEPSQASDSDLESWVNQLARLLKKSLALEASVKLAQDLYFDGHPILFRNVEETLQQAIDATTDAIEEFAVFLPLRDRIYIEVIRKKPGLLDVEEIAKGARQSATMDMLRERGVGEAVRWQVWRKSRIEVSTST
jgi:hypothetical protein